MEEAPTSSPAGGAPRRVVLAAGAAGAAGALAGCSVYGGQQPAPPPPPPPPPSADDSAGDQEGGESDTGDGDGGGEADAGGTPFAQTADVPVGGGLIDTDLGVVVTQPASGEFRAFSASCTHQGCLVTEVDDNVIICRCHESRFSIEDGSVVQAAQGSSLTPDTQEPLPEVGIVVDGDTIALAS